MIYHSKTKILLVLSSTFLSLMICESFLRLSGYTSRVTDKRMYVPTSSKLLPHELKPNYSGFYMGCPVTIDSEGYRTVSISPAARQWLSRLNSAPVLLLVGDSLVFGHGLRDEQTIASRTQMFLFEQRIPLIVKNIGAAGYTSWNEKEAVKKFWNRHSSDIVVVFYVPNDVSTNNDQLGIAAGNYSVLSNTHFHRLTELLYSHFYALYFFSDNIKKIYTTFSKSHLPSHYESYLDPVALNYSMSALEGLKKECEKRNSLFFVAVYRDTWHYTNRTLSEKYESLVFKALKARDIPFFLLKSHIDNLPIEKAKLRWNDPHPSAKAVEYLSHELLQHLNLAIQKVLGR